MHATWIRKLPKADQEEFAREGPRAQALGTLASSSPLFQRMVLESMYPGYGDTLYRLMQDKSLRTEVAERIHSLDKLSVPQGCLNYGFGGI